MTGVAFVRNERKVPTELQITPGAKDPEGLMEALRQAYCQDSRKLSESVVLRVKESKHGEKLKERVTVVEQHMLSQK
jgi:hypothetical protein